MFVVPGTLFLLKSTLEFRGEGLKILDLAQARAVMANKGWVSTLPHNLAERFLSLTSHKHLKKGEYFQHIGDEHRIFFGVATGALLLHVPVPPRGVICGHVSLPADWMGIGPALTKTDRQVAFEAATATDLLTISATNFNQLVMEHPDVTKHVVALVMINQRTSLRTAADLLIQNPRTRLVARLLTLSGLKLNERAERRQVNLPITQEQLAAMSSLSRATVNRILSDLETVGLCTGIYGGIGIPDLFELEASLDEANE